MILPDVNVLIYAFRRDSARHAEYRAWLQAVVDGPNAYGVSPQVLAGVVRICTHPKIYRQPSALRETLSFCEVLLEPAHSTLIQPGDRHWSIFTDLCESSAVSGNLVQDAWFAALAIEHGCQWISTDADYGRFSGLRWQRPFE
jgi:toxin-antitoxin system PIN domain toxin